MSSLLTTMLARCCSAAGLMMIFTFLLGSETFAQVEPSTALELSLSPSQLWESAGATTITATVALNGVARTTETRVTVLVPYGDLDGGTAYPLTILANEPSATRTFTYTPEDDSDPEPPEAVVLEVFSSAPGLAVGSATLVIIDDDAASAITLSVSPEWVAETAGATTVTVTAALDAGTRGTATEVTVSRTGGMATSATDHVAVEDFTLTIPAEQTSGTGTLTFTPTDDSDAEGAETVVLSGSATGLTAGTATLTITDDDSTPTAILLSASHQSVAETAGATTVTVTVALDAGTRSTATNVLVGLNDVTATSGTDYAAVNFFVVTIPAEQTSGTGTLTFTPTDDSLREPPETVIVSASVLGTTGLADPDGATLTITDDDAAALVTLSVSPEGVWEHLGAVTVTVTAALPEARATATEVTGSRTGGTAISGTDYAPVENFTVTIPAEQTSGTATFTFTPTDDSDAESFETVVLSERVRGRTLNTVPAQLYIHDDESQRRAIVLQADPRSVEEHAGATTVTVTAILATESQPLFGRSQLHKRARSFDTEVTVSVTGGTATSGTDYTSVEDFTLTIPARETSATATFTFMPTDDDAEVGNETVILSASGEDLVFGSDVAQTFRSTTLTIADDDTYVNANWPLKPSGLTTGDRFRLLFVTAEGRAPTSDGISDYNTYVQRQAGTDSAHDAIQAYSSHFRVLGSAIDVSAYNALDYTFKEGADTYAYAYTAARDNTWTTYTDDHKGVPIYWLGGNRVADDYEDFYDGDWGDEANPTDGSGQVISAEKVWTGSNSDGTARRRDEFGASTVGYGVLNGAGGPISSELSDNRIRTDKGYYALSRVFRVSATTVDPTGIALSVSPASVAEDGGATTVAVTATLDLGTRTTATEVTVSRTGGTATSGTDYAAVENFTVTIPADHLSGTGTFTLTPTDDDAVESADETVILSGSATGLTGGTATLAITDDDKFKPVFASSMSARSVAENTASAENVGPPVTATNPNNQPMLYTLGGTDVTSFIFMTESGQILTSSALDHEANSTYSVTVTAQTPQGVSATVTVTITVTDVEEPPEPPDTPTVLGIAADGLQVNWTAPKNTGPAISDYDVQYQADGSVSWIELDHVGTGLSTTITGLAAGTYAAQVRATNPEGTSDWSPAGTGTTKVLPTEVASGWSLAPSGLEAGDTFRLLFRSSGTRDATSTDIGDYNTFVQDAAAAGHADIQDYSAGFRAVASTANVDARANTVTFYTDDHKGPPIYWLGGAQLADDYEDFYDKTWDVEASVRNENGAEVTVPAYALNASTSAWTGSNHAGTEAFQGTSSRALGGSQAAYGVLNFPLNTVSPLYVSFDYEGTDDEFPLYGLSEVFQIGSDAAGVTVDPTTADVTEGGTTDSYTVVLDSQPGSTVTVSVGGAGDDLSVSSSSLTFTTLTWNTAQAVTVTAVDDAIAEGEEEVTLTHTVSGYGSVTSGDNVTVTITDNDTAPTGLTLSVSPGSVGEGDGGTTVTVTATLNGSVTLSGATTVTVSVGKSGDSATSGTDYTSVNNFTMTIAAEQASGTGTFTLTPTDDSVAEGDETISVTGSATGLTVTDAEVTITDNDTTPTGLTLSVSPGSVGEGAGGTTVTVTATLNGSVTLSGATTVTVSVGDASDSATSGTDYASVNNFTMTIGAEQASGSGTFTLTPTDDSIAEGDETISVEGSATGLTVTDAEVTITDNDTAPTGLTLSVSPSSVGEGDGGTTVTVTATLNGSVTLSGATTVTVSVGDAGDSATSGTDYTSVNPFTMTIGAEQASGTGTFTLTPTDDSIAEGDETVSVEGSATGLTVTDTELTITDNDTAPTGIELSLSPNSVTENGGAATVTVTARLNGAVQSVATTVTVSVGDASDSAASGTDYTGVSNFTVTIGAEQASGTGTFTLTPTDDSIAEGDETVSVEGSATGLTVTDTELTITDNDTAPTGIELSLSPNSVTENGGAATVTVTARLNGAVRSVATTVTVSVGDVSDSAKSGTDYTGIANFTVTIAMGQMSGTGTFALTPTDDSIVEGDETVSVSGSPSGLADSDTETLTITDNDTAPTGLTLSVSPSSVGEGDGGTTVTVTATLNGSVTLSGATAVTVSVGKSGDSATSGTDYTGIANFTVTIAAEQASGSETFTISPTDDSIAEGDEKVSVTGSATGLTVTDAELTITDNDTAPTGIELSLSPDSVTENGGSQTVTVTATLNGAVRSVATTVTVSVGKSGDSATSGTDYTGISNFTVTIAMGQMSGTGTFTLTPTDDSIVEGDETVSVSGSPSGLADSDTETLTITDNDTAPTGLTLSVSPSSVGEGDGGTTVTVTATLNGSVTLSGATVVTVSVGKSGDSATSGTDYTSVNNFTVTIAMGQASGTGTFALTPTDDSIAEGDETVSVTGSATGLTVTGAEVTITDNDTAPTGLTLSVSPGSVGEGDGGTTVTVTATLNGSVTFSGATAVTVSVGKSGDSATEGTDYTSVNDFTMTIAAEQASGSGTFTLTPTDDSIAEGDEKVSVEGSATGLTVTDTELTITDNDTAPTGLTLSVSPGSVGEGDGGTTVTVTATLNGSVTLSGATAVTVSVGKNGDSATEGTDYTSVNNFTMTIAMGQASGTGMFTLTPTNDSIAEGDETISVTGSATGLTVTDAELTITDNDTAPTGLTLSVSPSSVGEGAGGTTVTVTATLNGSVTLSGATAVTVSVGRAVTVRRRVRITLG